MARLIVVLVVLVLMVGGLYFLSTRVRQQPTHTIEVPVSQGANAH